MDIIVGLAFLYLIVVLVLDFFGVSSEESAETDSIPEPAANNTLE